MPVVLTRSQLGTAKALFDRSDIERAMNFHTMLKERFAKDLAILQVKLS
jgi:DNA-binding protein